MFPSALLPSSPAMMTISGTSRFICVHQPDALVVYPKSPRARKNDIPAVRARPRRPRESLLPGPPKSPAAAKLKWVADSSFQRGWEKSNGLFWTAPFWNRTHPAAAAIRSVRARTATARRWRVAVPRRFLGIRRGSLMALPTADACFEIRSAFGPSRAFIHFNDFLSSSSNSLSESDLTRMVPGRGSTGSPCRGRLFLSWTREEPISRTFRVARTNALAVRESTHPGRRPWCVAAFSFMRSFMRSGVVRDRPYQGFAAKCGLSGPDCNQVSHMLGQLYHRGVLTLVEFGRDSSAS